MNTGRSVVLLLNCYILADETIRCKSAHAVPPASCPLSSAVAAAAAAAAVTISPAGYQRSPHSPCRCLTTLQVLSTASEHCNCLIVDLMRKRDSNSAFALINPSVWADRRTDEWTLQLAKLHRHCLIRFAAVVVVVVVAIVVLCCDEGRKKEKRRE